MSLLKLYRILESAEDDIGWDEAERTWPECSAAWERDAGATDIKRIVPVGGILFANVETVPEWWRYEQYGRGVIHSASTEGRAGTWQVWAADDVRQVALGLAKNDPGVKVSPATGWVKVFCARSAARDQAMISLGKVKIIVHSTFPLTSPFLSGGRSPRPNGPMTYVYHGHASPELVQDVVRAVSDRGDMGRNDWGQDNLD